MYVLEFYMHVLDGFWGGLQIGDLQFIWRVLHMRVFVRFVDYVEILEVFSKFSRGINIGMPMWFVLGVFVCSGGASYLCILPVCWESGFLLFCRVRFYLVLLWFYFLSGCVLGNLFSDHSCTLCFFLSCKCRLKNALLASAYKRVIQSYIENIKLLFFSNC